MLLANFSAQQLLQQIAEIVANSFVPTLARQAEIITNTTVSQQLTMRLISLTRFI